METIDVILALFASVFWGVSDFLGGFQTRRVPVGLVLAVSQVAGLAGIVVVLLVRGQPAPASFGPLWAIAAGGASIVSLATIYLAAARGPMIVVAPVAALGAAVPVVVGVAEGDPLSLTAVLGIALALVGITVAGWQTGRQPAGARGCLAPVLAAVSALTLGAFLVFLDQASHASPYWATAVMRVSSCALVFGYLALTRPRVSALRGIGRPGLLMIAAVGLTDMGAEISFATASQAGELSVVAVLASLYPVVTVAMAIVILRDRANLIQACGAVLTMGGAALLAGARP